MMKRNSNVVMIVLIVLLALAIGYIVYTKYSEMQVEKQFTVYQQGAQAGYEQAIIQMFQQAGSCQQVPLTYNNQTINILAVECLQQAAA